MKAEALEAISELADAVWRESQEDTTIIRDAGIKQDIVHRIDKLTGGHHA